VTASVVSIAILLFCVSASAVYAIEAGKAPGGAPGGAGGLFFDVEPGVAAFVILWCLATLGGGAYWFRALRRPHRAISPSASALP
jgi:hypothetical protein